MVRQNRALRTAEPLLPPGTEELLEVEPPGRLARLSTPAVPVAMEERHCISMEGEGVVVAAPPVPTETAATALPRQAAE